MIITHIDLSLTIDNLSLHPKNVMFDLNQCFSSMPAEVVNLRDMLDAPAKHLIQGVFLHKVISIFKIR